MEENKKKRPKGQRIIAIVGVVLLAALYLITLISAIFTTPATQGLFKACLFSTVAVPFMIYGYMLIYRLLKQKGEEMSQDK